VASAVAPTSQVPTVTVHQRARDILGLNRSQVTTVQRSLEIEVENYLNEGIADKDPLIFWQVDVAPVF
jgi:hypothetical protein